MQLPIAQSSPVPRPLGLRSAQPLRHALATSRAEPKYSTDGIAADGVVSLRTSLWLASAGATIKLCSQRSKERSCQKFGKQRERYSTVLRRATLEKAAARAADMDFKKLDTYDLGDLEALYIDANWFYFQKEDPILTDQQFDQLKQLLYQKGSQFPTLRKEEIAYVEAAIAYHRGEPIVSDEEYDKLKKEVEDAGGRRKDITAFLLFNRGERLLSSTEFADLKDEVSKLGLAAVDLESCTLAQLEEMYVDALWAYYNDGVQILSDEQYEKLREELSWQGSGFPTLRAHEIQFVKAAVSYWNGSPVASDEEWKALKERVKQDERRSDVTAFLLYTKGKQLLDPETFDKMSAEMRRLGMSVQKDGVGFREAALSVSSDSLSWSPFQSAFLYAALTVVPTVLAILVIWVLGLAVDSPFVPDLELGSIFSEDSIGLLLVGGGLGLYATSKLTSFLGLDGGEVVTGTCPACSAEVNLFIGEVEKQNKEVARKCDNCGTPMVWDTVEKRIVKAGMGAKIEADTNPLEWSTAWRDITSAVETKTDGKVKKLDPKTTFKIWDKSGDGCLTKSEFGEALKDLGIRPSNKDLDALFRKADTNNDGTIDYEEFVYIYQEAGGGGWPTDKYIKDAWNFLQGR